VRAGSRDLARYGSVIVAVASLAMPICAQRASSTDSFEVASIKPRSGARILSTASRPDRFTHPDATLIDLMRYAYNVQAFQIEGGPGWMRSSRFEVNAKAATVPSVDGMRALVRRLLADRFMLRTRTDTREMPMYELVVARRDGALGEKLRRSTFDCEAVISSGTATAEDLVRCDLRFRPKMVQARGGRPAIESMTLMLQGVRLSRLATLLQNEVERVIVDKTGLDGTWDLEVEFAQQGRRPAGLPGPPSPPPDGPPLMTAIQEQLGLKLESVRGPVPILVIDSAELPTPD
jgi:uncharacterized protein (TIGR03435 family)